MQEVQLDSKVKLLDSPGVVLASGLKSDASVALRNAIRTGNVKMKHDKISRKNSESFLLKTEKN